MCQSFSGWSEIERMGQYKGLTLTQRERGRHIEEREEEGGNIQKKIISIKNIKLAT